MASISVRVKLDPFAGPRHPHLTGKPYDVSDKSIGFVTTDDDVRIFYKDWGPKDAQPIVFHHGWPLSSDD